MKNNDKSEEEVGPSAVIKPGETQVIMDLWIKVWALWPKIKSAVPSM